MQLPDENNHCRLARALIERRGCTYEQAVEKLGTFRLHLECGEEVAASLALQAALLTAVNTGKRAFLGGVTVNLPPDVPSLLPWPKHTSLNGIVVELGALTASSAETCPSQTLFFGTTSLRPTEDDLSIHTAGWRGGIAPAAMAFQLPPSSDHPSAGVLAASLGVARSFLRVSEIGTKFVTSPLGLSLWNPAAHWLDADAGGPPLEYLPQNLWVLGLGHLGQAFLWNLGLLPFSQADDVLVVLQDYDYVVPANWSAGLLCDKELPARQLKTRLCARWLEARAMQTKLIERKFDETLRLEEAEKFVAFCGFDKAPPRVHLERSGFARVVECGVGESADDFDQIDFHSFPSTIQTAESLWQSEGGAAKKTANEMLRRAYEVPGQACGILAETLADKSLSSSFVGAFAGAVAMGEILRGLHNGESCEAAAYNLRSTSSPRTMMAPSQMMSVGACGYVPTSENPIGNQE